MNTLNRNEMDSRRIIEQCIMNQDEYYLPTSNTWFTRYAVTSASDVRPTVNSLGYYRSSLALVGISGEYHKIVILLCLRKKAESQ
jgi:hypothetical protein